MSIEAGAITVRTVGVFLISSWPRRLVLGSLLLIPVLIAVLGGFRPAEPEVLEVPAGSTVDLGPATYRPTAFFVSDETSRSDLEYSDGAVAWVGVVVEVENVIDERLALESAGPASDAVFPLLEEGVRVEYVGELPRVVARVADGSRTYALPGIPTQVAYLWPVSSTDAIGDSLTIRMTQQEFTYAPMSGEDRWLSLGDIWTMSLPRTELPPGLYEPPEDDL